MLVKKRYVKNCFAYGSTVNFLAQTATPQPVNYKSFINQMSINLFTWIGTTIVILSTTQWCKGLLIVSYVSSTRPTRPVLLTASQAFMNEWPRNEPFLAGFQLSALSFARVFLSDDVAWPGRKRITTEESILFIEPCFPSKILAHLLPSYHKPR